MPSGETWDEQLMQVAMLISENEDKTPAYTRIIKTIMASEPPFAAELESHVKFAKVWGGGGKQQITKDICSYIKLCDNVNHVYSASFDALSGLKLPPTQLVPKFIGAVIKLLATRTTKAGGNKIASKDLKTIASVQLEPATKANEFMVRADTLCKGDHETIRGTFECDLVECVFKTFEDEERKKMTMNDFVSKFLEEISNPSGAASSNIDSTGHENTTSDQIFDATAPDAVRTLLEKKDLCWYTVGTEKA